MNNKNTIRLLTICSIAGTIGTAILSIKATQKAVRILNTYEDEMDKEPSLKDKIELLLPIYVPTILTVGSTIFCILSVNHISKKSQGSILAAYSLLETQFKEYKKSVKTIYGENSDDEIINNVLNDKIIDSNLRCTDKNEVIFIEDLIQEPFISTIEQVQRAEYELNRLFILRGYASVNDFLTFIGVDEKGLGDMFGWSFDIGVDYGYEWIDFTHEKIDYNGREAYLIHYTFEPIFNFLMDY